MDRQDPKDVARRLRALQRQLGSAVQELELVRWARLIHKASGRTIAAKTLHRYLAGERLPTWEAFVAIAATDPKQRGPGWLAYGVVERVQQKEKSGQTDGTLDMPPARTKKDEATSVGPKRVG